MVWSNQNQISTVAVLCPSPLHCHQYKWSRFKSGKVREFDDHSLKRKADRRMRRGDWECTPCALQSSLLPGPSSSRLQNLQWAIALCDWHPAQATLLITFVQQNWEQRRWTQPGGTELALGREKKMSWFLYTYIHPTDLRVQVFCFVLCFKIKLQFPVFFLELTFAFFCLWIWFCESLRMYHIWLPGPLFVSGFFLDISVQTMKL